MSSILKNGAALLLTALDQGRPVKERQAALREANDCRSKAKVGWPKLGAPQGFNMAALVEELKELRDAEQHKLDEERAEGEGMVTAPKEPAIKKPKDPNRGGIGRMVNLLLTTTDADYASIEAQVKRQYPEAKTTARSIASVAADLRRAGVDVKTRRRQKATV